MKIFSGSSPFDSDVEKVTPEEDKDGEDWAKILDICDKVGSSSIHARDCLKSIVKRLNNANPHVVLKAITLLDACVNNCSKIFHLEVASRDFETDYRKLLKKYQQTPRIADSLKLLLKKWAENDFKSDPQLSLIPSLYQKLKQEGVEFPSNQEPKSNMHIPKDPNAVTSQQEVDDIAKAIELSLKETKLSSGSSGLYPTASSLSSGLGNRSYGQNNASKSKQIVKALYDFEAVEDNELTFYAGETIEVLDDTDSNWWKGMNHRGEGLFPTNFVTPDLSYTVSSENDKTKDNSSRKNRVHFNDSVTVNSALDFKRNVVINEQKIDRLLHLLHEANPTDESADPEEMLTLEDEVNAMGPLIDAELEKVDRKHNKLTQLSSNLVDALNLYHSLMREPFHTLPSTTKAPYVVPSMPMHGVPPHQVIYNSGMNGYNIPSGNMMPEQYPPNSVPSSSLQQPTNIQQNPHHFIPIPGPPVQPDSNNFMIPSQPNPYQQGMPPNMVPYPYHTLPPQQVSQNPYPQMRLPVPSQDSPPTGNVQNR